MHLSERGLNPPVSGIRAMFELAREYDNVINLCIGEPGFPTPPNVIGAGRDALYKGYTKYTPNAGIPGLREALSQKLLRENKIQADPETEIIVTAGGVEAVLLAMMVTVNPGDEVLVPIPSWPNYPEQIKFVGGTMVPVPAYEKDGFVPTKENIEERITEKTKVLVLNSPNNPTGGVISRGEMEEICKLVRKHDLTIISDEPYERLLYDGAEHVSPASLPNMKEHVITVNTFSKTFAMSGWRVGYASGPKQAIGAMVQIIEQVTSSVNAAAQYACIEALNHTEKAIQKMVKGYQRNRDILVEGLNGCKNVSCRCPLGAFYAFPNIQDTGLTSAQLAADIVKEVQVVTTPGPAFGIYGEGYLRLSYASSETEIREAVKRLQQYFNR
ncbi:pyridoxal phosphate-dependent aminotransferase [Lactonifactor longoviformis]|uniref:pyridoxal phosphate-dependent aminotransferase n=1 Tax=Lactonifactor longoviformis TaxID=341220 RepID=UPI0036F3015C